MPKVEVAPVEVMLREVVSRPEEKVEVPAAVEVMIPVLSILKRVVVANAAVEDEIWKSVRLVSPPTAASESFANGDVVPRPKLPAEVRRMRSESEPESALV